MKCGDRIGERRRWRGRLNGPEVRPAGHWRVIAIRLGCVAALLLALVGRGLTAEAERSELRAVALAEQLDGLKAVLCTEIQARLETNILRGSYTTVWRQFEEAAIEALCEALPRHVPGLRAGAFDRGQPGQEKNRLADLAIVCADGVIEISIKTARAAANPENDLGTFRDYPRRKRLFAASFALWVRYVEAGETIRCDRVFFDRAWRFVGRSAQVDGVKYRKKDGNMRPKPWAMFDSGAAFWNSEAEFEAALRRSETHRANELIKEYLATLSDNDLRLLYETLRQRLENGAQARP